MPIVTVQQSPRDLDRKRRLVTGITQAFVDAYEVRPEAVQVYIHEIDDENWAKAGKLAADGLAPASETTHGSGGRRSPADTTR